MGDIASHAMSTICKSRAELLAMKRGLTFPMKRPGLRSDSFSNQHAHTRTHPAAATHASRVWNGIYSSADALSLAPRSSCSELLRMTCGHPFCNVRGSQY